LVVGSQAVVQPAPARHSIGPVVVSTHGLDVRAGEVVGLAGMPGAGQAGVVAAVLTAHPGAAHIPQDRQAAGFVAELPIATNLVLNRLGEFTRRGLLRRDQITATAQRLADEYGISTPVAAPAATLSGGNQQRLVLARELSLPRQVVVACEPTSGLDVAAVGFVHQQLRRARDGGAAVLLVSSDADELALLADRVVETSEVLDAS
ncbi:MAG: ATP-binding cassette domain-containing protein, partial [Brooklawnia sp.]